MRLSFLASAALAGVVAVSAAAVSTNRRLLLLERRDNATTADDDFTLPPSNSTWYDPPSGSSEKEDGAVLKSRKVSTAFDGYSTAYQLLYRTTDAHGGADATNTLVFVPPEPVSPPRIVLYLAPADTAAADCSLQYAALTGTQSNAGLGTVATNILASLSKGYYVSFPDHEGSQAAYISGVTEARAALDGLKALLNFDTALPSKEGYKAVIDGYSGGGHAAGWATQYLTTYGKDLNVVGASMGGVPVTLAHTLDLISGSNSTSLVFSALAGLANTDSVLDTWLSENLHENGTTAIAEARKNANCLGASTSVAASYAGANLYSFFKGGEAALHEGYMAGVLAAAKLGEPMPDGNDGVFAPIPVFLYHSKVDDVVSYTPIRPFWLDQCKKGAKIHLATTTGYDHITTYLQYLGDSFRFLDRAFEGTTGLDSCVATDGVEAEVLSEEYVQSIGEVAANNLQAILGLANSTTGRV
ncbi:hypothetical protein JCM6882_000187 [Rhodosporidiobolus microsporus]